MKRRTDPGGAKPVGGSNVRHPDTPVEEAAAIELPPGRYHVWGFPPETGLLLDKWIEVRAENRPGRYGAADLRIATCMPNLLKIEDTDGKVVWAQGAAR